MNDETVKNMMIALAKWHEERVKNCNLIIDKRDAELVMKTEDGQEFRVEAGTKESRCIRLGIMLALEQFTPFPVTITGNNDDGDEEDSDDE